MPREPTKYTLLISIVDERTFLTGRVIVDIHVAD